LNRRARILRHNPDHSSPHVDRSNKVYISLPFDPIRRVVCGMGTIIAIAILRIWANRLIASPHFIDETI
jgi:hypothetical protein